MLAIYTRLSKEDDNSNSISNQIREAEEYIQNNNIKEYKIYNEGEGFSGTLRIKERPQLMQMIQDIEDGIISSVWMRRQDRLARSGFVVEQFADSIKRNRIELYFGDKGKIDLSDPMQKFNLTIMGAVDELKPMAQSKATKKAISDNLKEGKTHGVMPYGYTKDDNRKMIVDDDEAKTIRKIYKWSLEGIGTNKIAEKLNDFGTPTRYNKIGKGTLSTKDKYDGRVTTVNKTDIKWSGNTVRNIIKNTVYKGIRKSKKNNTEYKCPPIFEANYWKKVNDNLSKNRNNSGRKIKYNYLLKGKVICGKCGRNYYGYSRESKKDHYYKCSSTRYKNKRCGNRGINIDVFEDFIWQRFFVGKVLKDKIQQHLLNTDTEERIVNINKEIEGFEIKLFKLNKEEYNVDTALAKGQYSDEKYSKQMKRINEEKQTLDTILNNLKEDLIVLKDIESNSDSLIQELENLKVKTSFNQKRELIKKYIGKIVIDTHRENAFNGFLKLQIHYDKIIEDIEVYIIPYVNNKYFFALEVCNEIIIPLNKEFKSMNKKDLSYIVERIYITMNKTLVHFYKSPNSLDEIYSIWLNMNNWKKEFEIYCKQNNLPDAVIYGQLFSS